MATHMHSQLHLIDLGGLNGMYIGFPIDIPKTIDQDTIFHQITKC